MAQGQFARGYRLACVSFARVPGHWTLMAFNLHDSNAAPHLIPKVAGHGGYIAADNAFDSNACHELAARHNHQLVAPPRARDRDVRDARRNCPQRLRASDLLHGPPPHRPDAFGRSLYNLRQRIESGFGGLTAIGLGHLPPWVRRPRRVALWAAAKLLLFLWRQAQKQGLMTMRQ